MSLLRLAWRESRVGRGRLALALAGIAVGVAALVAVQAFASTLRAEAREQARALLGADLAVTSRQPFGESTRAFLSALQEEGAPVSEVRELTSMARLEGGGIARLVRLRAAEGGFPFYGRPPAVPADAWERLEQGGGVLVEPGFLLALGGAVGDSLVLGERAFEIVGAVERGGADVDIASAFAPRVEMHLGDLESTGLIQFGSLVEHAAYAVLEPARAAALAREWRPRLRAERTGISTAEQQAATLGLALERLVSYLGLVSVLALLLGGIGATSALRAHLAEREETVALLRCLGATRRQVFSLYLGQALAVGLAGAALGAAAGLLLQRGLPLALSGLLPVEVPPRLDLRAAGLGVATGLWVALAFALPPLLEARQVPPLRALRRRVEVARRRDRSWGAAVGLLALTAVGVVVLQSGNVRLGLVFAAGAGGALLLLYAGVAGALRLLRRAPLGRFSFAWRHGIANLQRPGSSARPVALALGAGTLLLVLLLAVEATLLRPLRFEQVEGRGNLLLWDVQDDQEAGVSALLTGRGHPPVQAAPIIPMRIAAVNGRLVGPAAAGAGNGEEPGPSGWAARREYRSTVRDTMVGSERLRAGRWWERAADAEVSLEEGVARELGVGVGDWIEWDVQGARVATRVGSLREVEWTRFEPNFFAVFPPAVLAGAPRTWIVLTRVEGEDERAALQGEVVRRYPNVSVLDLTHLQGVVDRVLGRVALAVRFLAAFTLAVGLVVLAAAAAASRRERMREGVLLRTMGATRGQLRGLLLAESFVLGAAGATLGAAAGTLGAWALARWLFSLPFVFPLLPAALTVLAVAALSALAGWGAAGAASRGTALQALRDE